MSNAEAKKLCRLAGCEVDPLKARRLRGVTLVLEGASISAAAREIGMDRVRFSHWLALYREHGLAGLADRRSGRSELAKWQLDVLATWARRGHGAGELARLVEKHFQLAIGAAAIRQILRERCGLTWHVRRWRAAG